jgi:erythronate-4-phosphate dehydrogenase
LAGGARERAQAFDRLRKYYPVRREFSTLDVGGIDPSSDLGLKLNALGFRIAGEF